MQQSIAYLMSRFPHLSETFILREMNELQRREWNIELYPLMIQSQAVVHPEAAAWVPQAQRVPWMSLPILKNQLVTGFQQSSTFSRIWGQTVRGYLTKPSELVRALALLPKAVQMARLMQQQSIAHIHVHYATYPALVAWVIHQLTGISYSVTVHAHDIYVSQAMLARKLQKASFIVAISRYNKRFLRRYAGLAVSHKTHVIHCGIKPHQYARSQVHTAADTPWQIVSIGSLQEYKGFPYLIHACALLRDRGIPFRCRIIGGGELQQELEQHIHEQHLQGWVELLGPQTEQQVQALLAESDCYVQPSIITAQGKMEGIPVALMEALATGLPVIATNISGIPELVRHQETGLLVPPAQAQALADALAQLYDHPDVAIQYAQAGQRLVYAEFDLHQNVAQLAHLLQAVVPQAAPQTI